MNQTNGLLCLNQNFSLLKFHLSRERAREGGSNHQTGTLKTFFEGRQPSIEDNPQLKMTFDGGQALMVRLPLMEDNL